MIKPRGIRNNNPLNIRRGSKWVGLKTKQSDEEFCQFTTMGYGFRAAFILLNRYYTDYNLCTLEKIIKRWAPPSENHTDAYIDTVKRQYAKYTGKAIDEQQVLLPVKFDKTTWCNIVRSMVAVECGAKWADNLNINSTISSGYNLAFL